MWQMSELSEGVTRRKPDIVSAGESTPSEFVGLPLHPPMPAPFVLHDEYTPSWRLRIRTKLLVAVNAVQLIGLSALLVWDFQRGLAERLSNKQISMTEEAALVLSALEAIRDQCVTALWACIDIRFGVHREHPRFRPGTAAIPRRRDGPSGDCVNRHCEFRAG